MGRVGEEVPLDALELAGEGGVGMGPHPRDGARALVREGGQPRAVRLVEPSARTEREHEQADGAGTEHEREQGARVDVARTGLAGREGVRRRRPTGGFEPQRTPASDRAHRGDGVRRGEAARSGEAACRAALSEP